jgi:hypothetical protein
VTHEAAHHDRLMGEIRQLKRALEDVSRYRPLLLDLLARIHRDGGQRIGEVGLENAATEADAEVARMLQVIDAATRHDRGDKHPECQRIVADEAWGWMED